MFDLEVILSIWTIVPFFVPRHPAKTISGWIEIDFEYKSETYGLKNKVFRQFFAEEMVKVNFIYFGFWAEGPVQIHTIGYIFSFAWFILRFISIARFENPILKRNFENQYHREFLEKDLWKNLKTKLKGPIYKKS